MPPSGKELEARVSHIRGALKNAKGITTDRHIPEIANELPHVTVEWDEEKRGLTAQQVADKAPGRAIRRSMCSAPAKASCSSPCG